MTASRIAEARTPARGARATLGLLCFTCLALGASAAAPAETPPRELERMIQASRAGLRATLAAMADDPDLFPEEPLGAPRVLAPERRAQVVAVWARVADLLLALDRCADETADFWRRDGDERRARLALHRAAWLASYRFGMDFVQRMERDPGFDAILNEALPEVGLSDGSYGRLEFRALNVLAASRYAALEALHVAGGGSHRGPLAEAAEEDAARILAMGRGAGPRMTAANALEIVRDAALGAWLPAQEHAARWMGEVRVRRWGEALIDEAQIAELLPRLEPGDIVLQRREWYLTNAGIPGFWPHVALYVGTSEERARFFDGAEVARWLRSQGATTYEELLRARHPEAWAASQRTREGRRPRILEAIADGVTFTTLEHSASADSLAVLRPRLSRRERAAALLRAFGYAGRPYDYDFDFVTDAALVCSELVYKTYQPGEGMRGLRLPLESVAGRLLMPPNALARSFASERGGPAPQLDFVLMLDGDERAGTAHPASAEVFAETWRRPKWHILTAGAAAPQE